MFNRIASWALFGGLLFTAACAQPAPSFSEAGEGVEVKGRVIRLISDDFSEGHSGSAVHYILETRKGERIALAFNADTTPVADRELAIEGVRKGRVLEVVRAALEPNDLGHSQQALVAEGTRRIAILLFNFQKNAVTPFTGAAVQTLMFGAQPSSATYFAEQSFGRVRFEGRDSAIGEVYGWHTIEADPADCDPQLWQQQARAIATAKDGVDFAKYEHIVMYFPNADSCPWAGLAESPGKLVWMQGGALNSTAFEHELLHNLGIHHANVLRCLGSDGKPSSVSGQCSEEAYADPFDPMGYGGSIPPPHTNGKNKAFLGWIPKENVAYVSASADYSLHPLEAKSVGLQVLAIPLPDKRFYWLDFRQRIGTDGVNFKAAAAIVNGIGVRMSRDAEGFATTSLVDTLPLTKSVDDSAITVGRTYVDAQHGVRITTLSITDGVAKVRIQIGEDPLPEPEPPFSTPDAGTSAPTPTGGDPTGGDVPNDNSADAGIADGPVTDDPTAERDAGELDVDPADQRPPRATRSGPVTGGMGCHVGAGSPAHTTRVLCFAIACLACMRALRRRRTA